MKGGLCYTVRQLAVSADEMQRLPHPLLPGPQLPRPLLLLLLTLNHLLLPKVFSATRGGTIVLHELRWYNMNGRSQIQGGKNWILPKETKCKPVPLRLSLAENLEIPLMSLYGTEWRERGYGLRVHSIGSLMEGYNCLKPVCLDSSGINHCLFLFSLFSKSRFKPYTHRVYRVPGFLSSRRN
jgi:hypothetical protein